MCHNNVPSAKLCAKPSGVNTEFNLDLSVVKRKVFNARDGSSGMMVFDANNVDDTSDRIAGDNDKLRLVEE